MALGYCEAVVLHLATINENYNGTKVTQPGFLNMLLQTPNAPEIVAAYGEGHRREVRVKYKTPVTENQVSTSEHCGVDVIPAYAETTVSLGKYVQLSMHITDDKIRQYCADASATVAVGLPATRMMSEHLDSIRHAMRGLYAKMETQLTTAMATQFGVNARTGASTSTSVNFNLNGSTQNFAEGLTRILTDAAINELCGTPMIVGNGHIHGFAMNYLSQAYGLNQNGIDQARLADALGFQFFHSQKTATTWGANQFGVFAPGSVHLITNPRNVGNFAQDLGTVKQFTMVDPGMQCWAPNGLGNFVWDVQLEYNACTESKSGGYAGSTSVGRGWMLTLSANYDLFVSPSGTDGADALAGVNGALRYTATNS